jgi:predicted amidohydrolase YtcJ
LYRISRIRKLIPLLREEEDRRYRMANQKLILLIFLLTCLLMAGCSIAEKPDPASLVIINSRIVTLAQDQPYAQAMAVSGDRILAVGSNQEIKKYIGGNTEVLALDDKLVIPGFIDGHAHFTGIGKSLQQLDLTGAETWDDIVGWAGEAAAGAEPGDWILGRGWHQAKWNTPPDPAVEGLPLHTELSRVTPDNPVFFAHASGHSCLVNAKAMELAGVTTSTKNPDGGEILRDSNGRPTGAFRETAQGLVGAPLIQALASRTPEQIEADLRETIELASEDCLSKGITSLHDAGSSFSLIDLFKKMVDEGALKIRLNVMLSESNQNLEEKISEYRLTGYGNNMLTVRSIKRLIDGALGSHGAWFMEPYSDLPSTTGLQTCSSEVLEKTAQIALANDFQVCVHAIGDRGNREVLDIYETALAGNRDARWRIEHAQHLTPSDIPRFSQLGVMAAMQGIHCTSDGPWVVEKLGEERAESGAYVWRKLLDSGAVIGNGTDGPVEDVNPLECYYATVTRRLDNGEQFYPEQCMTRLEALKSYTINNAYLSFEEAEKGSLEPGKLADITVLSNDILAVPEEELLETEVLYTIVGGRILYQKD